MKFNRRRSLGSIRRDAKTSSHRRLARRASILELLEGRSMLSGTPFHNEINPRDVNRDNRISPADALLIINDLLRNGAHSLNETAVPLAASGSTKPPAAIDVTGDGRVTPQDAIKVISLLAVDKLMQFRTFATDTNGNPLSQVALGQDFLLTAVVDDVRIPPGDPQGVYSAYGDVDISDNALVSFEPGTLVYRDNDSNTDDYFDPPLVPGGTITPGGDLAGAGAASQTLSPPATGGAPQLLWTILVHANAAGTVNFTPAFDASGHETLLWGTAGDPLTADQIDFVGSSLQIIGTPQISVAPKQILEGNAGTTQLVFTLGLTSPVATPVTVEFATSNGTATVLDNDYIGNTGTATFAANATTALVTVTVNGDLKVENNENFTISLSNPSANAELNVNLSTALGTITNDDQTPTASINDQQVTALNGSPTTRVFTVSLSPPAGLTATVEFNTADVSALEGVDYEATSGTLTFNTGQTTQFITVTILADGGAEPVETFKIQLHDAVNMSIPDTEAIGTINPASPIPSLQPISSVSLNEGQSGNTPFVFTLNLSSPASDEIHVAFNTVNGTATVANNDYEAASGTVTFTQGQTSQTVTINVVGDLTVESDETFSVNFTPVSGTVIGGQTSAQATIKNDDGPPQITIGDDTVVAPAFGTVNAVFTVHISAAINQTVTLSYATVDNSAIAGEDYEARAGVLTFLPNGPSELLITVPVIGQLIADDDETFFVNLNFIQQGGAEITDGQAVGTIVRQGLVADSRNIVEGNDTHTDVINVRLTRAFDQQVTVAYATSPGTAGAGTDYVSTSGTLTFAAGVTTLPVTVTILGETLVESNETFFLDLSDSQGTFVLTDRAIITIVNDDGQTVGIDLRLTEPDGDPLGPVISVNDSFFLDVYVQDIRAVADRTGVASAYLDALYNSNLVMVTGPIVYGADFPDARFGNTNTLGIIDEAGAFTTIPPADPSAPQLLFRVPLQAKQVGRADFSANPAEDPISEVHVHGDTDIVPVNQVNYGTIISVNIGQNVFVIDNVTANEGNSGTTNFVFKVTRFLGNGLPASVQFATSDGTAIAGALGDYIAQSGVLSFSGADTEKFITIAVRGDTTDEANETFSVTLSNPDGAIASTVPAIGTITNDDSPPVVNVSNASASEGDTMVFTVSLSAASGKTVTVAFNTANALAGPFATAGVDYQTVSGVLTFVPGGPLQQTVTVPILADIVVESSENFRLVLSSPSNVTLGTNGVGTIIDVPPATISGWVYVDLDGSGTKNGGETGIPNVTISALRSGSTIPVTTQTNADGSFSLVGLQPGTYTLRETHPIFFGDGLDSHAGVFSTVSDVFTGITLQPSATSGGWYFGELGLQSQFASLFMNRRALFSSAVFTGLTGAQVPTSNTFNLRNGEVLVSFDGGWQGQRTLIAKSANPAEGSVAMALYTAGMVKLVDSIPTADGAKLVFTGTPGTPYILKVFGTNPNVTLSIIDAVPNGNGSSAGPLAIALTSPGPQSGDPTPAATPLVTASDDGPVATPAARAADELHGSSVDSASTTELVFGEEEDDWVADAMLTA